MTKCDVGGKGKNGQNRVTSFMDNALKNLVIFNLLVLILMLNLNFRNKYAGRIRTRIDEKVKSK